MKAFGEPIEQALHAAVDVAEQAAILRVDLRHCCRTLRLNFIDSRLRPVKNLLDPTHKVVAQLIELSTQLSSQLRDYLLAVLAPITHCRPSHALQEFSEQSEQ